jgi:hypothetical protein
VTQLYSRNWVQFSSPPTTHKATVEVFEPTSTRGFQLPSPIGSPYILDAHRIENASSKNSSVVAWLFVTAETCSPCRCLAMCMFSRSAIPAFVRNVTILFYLINEQLYDKYIALKLQSSQQERKITTVMMMLGDMKNCRCLSWRCISNEVPTSLLSTFSHVEHDVLKSDSPTSIIYYNYIYLRYELVNT